MKQFRMTMIRRIAIYTFVVSLICSAAASAQWVSTGGPAPEESASFVSVLAKGDTLFAGSYAGGGAYRSTDEGETWTEILPYTNDYAISITDSLLVVGSENGIFISTDFGSTWSRKVSNPAGYPNYIFGVFIKGGLMVAGTAAGVYRSTDGGNNWKSTVQSMNSIVMKDSVMLVGTSDGILESTDFGLTWDSTNSGLPPRSQYYDHWPRINTLTVSGGSIFAGASYSGVYKSTNDGKSWTSADSGLPAGQSILALSAVDGRLYTCPNLYGPVYASSDSGRSWHVAASKLAGGAVFEFAGNGGRLFAATKAGIFASSGPDSVWKPVLPEVPRHMSVRAFLARGDTLVASGIVAGYIDTFVSIDSGRVWAVTDSIFPPDWFSCLISGGKGAIIGGTWTTVYSSPGRATLLRTTDAGKNWTPSASGLPPYSVNHIIGYNGKLYAAIGDPPNFGEGPTPSSGEVGGLYVSNDDGHSWTLEGFKGVDVYQIDGGTDAILLATLKGLYVSTDGGSSWSTANLGFPADAVISSLASSRNIFYAGTPEGVYELPRVGGMWSHIPAPLQVDSVSSGFGLRLLVEGHELFAGTNAGVYLYYDNQWINVGKGLSAGAKSISSLRLSGGILYAATGEGIWMRPLREIMAEADSTVTIPAGYVLYQNYPNPFNPTTTISYSLVKGGPVEIQVFDVLGRLVRTLVDEDEAAGMHVVRLNASDLASGVYFYRLTAPGTSITRKMMLVK